MTLRFKMWIAIAALAFGLAIAGAAESATSANNTAHRSVHHKAAHNTVRVYRGVLPEVVTYSGGYVPPSARYQESRAAASEPVYDQEPGDDYPDGYDGYGYPYPYYGYWGWPLIFTDFGFADRRFDHFRRDGFQGRHVAFHHGAGGFHSGFHAGHSGFHTSLGGVHGGSGFRGFASPTGIGGFQSAVGGGMMGGRGH